MASASVSPTSRRAWQLTVFGTPDRLSLVDLPVAPAAELKAKEVLVKVLAADVSYADLVVLQGNMPGINKLPMVGGCDGIGAVVAVGAQVSLVKVGDRVAFIPMFGCLATYAVLPETECLVVRNDVDADTAVAAVMTGITTYHLLHTIAAPQLAKPGVKILVHACVGGTGAMLVQLAKLAGVEPGNIFGTCSAKNLATAAATGICALDYTATGADAWDARIVAATNGRGVDAVFDSVSFNGYYARGMSVLARGGQYIGYGMTNTSSPGALAVPSFIGLMVRITLQNSVWSRFNGRSACMFLGVPEAGRREAHSRYVNAVLDEIAAGRLKPFIGRVWTFEQAQEALLSIGRGHQGKQIVHIADE